VYAEKSRELWRCVESHTICRLQGLEREAAEARWEFRQAGIRSPTVVCCRKRQRRRVRGAQSLASVGNGSAVAGEKQCAF